jgi:predicted acylesterase/phospholipase RssA
LSSLALRRSGGGGVKGIGLIGALAAVTDAGYQLNRISGTAAGAVVGCLAAAVLTGDRLKECTLSLDYAQFKDPTPPDGIPFALQGLSVARWQPASTRATTPTNGSTVSRPLSIFTLPATLRINDRVFHLSVASSSSCPLRT